MDPDTGSVPEEGELDSSLRERSVAEKCCFSALMSVLTRWREKTSATLEKRLQNWSAGQEDQWSVVS